MVMVLFFAGMALMAWGLGLVRVGRQGRLVDDHPLCERCGFDLIGVYGEGAAGSASVCPECGSSLAAGAVRYGNRTRRPALIQTGWAVTVLGALSVIFAAYAGLGLAKHQPTWLLAWRAPSGDQVTLKELALRISAGEGSPALVGRVVGEALQAQARTGAYWEWAWGDIVESARTRGLVSDEEWARYIRQGYALSKMDIETKVSGDRERPEFKMRLGGDQRFGSGGRPPMFYVLARLEETSSGGGEIKLEQAQGAAAQLFSSMPGPPIPAGWLEIPGPRYGHGVEIVAWGRLKFTSPRSEVKARWEFRAMNPDGTVASEWEREYTATARDPR